MISTADLDTMARTLWGEARGEGRLGMQAVACVILNRARNPRWWGHDVRSVCLAKAQFSCWLPRPEGEFPLLNQVTAADAAFQLARAIADDALASKLADPTAGADTYANLRLSSPSWARGRTPCAVIGAHSFFRLELHAPMAAERADAVPPVSI